MLAKKIIIALEKKGLKEMRNGPGDHASKIRVIRSEIARECRVSVRTVNNWRTGKPPGKHTGELLFKFGQRMGVL